MRSSAATSTGSTDSDTVSAALILPAASTARYWNPVGEASSAMRALRPSSQVSPASSEYSRRSMPDGPASRANALTAPSAPSHTHASGASESTFTDSETTADTFPATSVARADTEYSPSASATGPAYSVHAPPPIRNSTKSTPLSASLAATVNR